MDMEGRKDRVEANLDRLVGIVGTLADHQVAFQDQLNILERNVTAVAEAHKRNKEAQQRNDEAIDEAINVLIRMMDEWIRHNPRS
jgi:exonuclease VII small subunit